MNRSNYSAIPKILVLAALALSACTLQVRTSVSPDGSGKLIAAINPEADGLAELASLNLDLAAVCSPAISPSVNLPPATVYSIETRGAEDWCVLDIPFDNLDTLRGVLIPASSAIAVNTLSLADERFIFDLSLDLTRRAEIEGIKLTPLTISWVLEVPGQLTGHNADLVDGNTLTWVVEPGVFRTLRAESNLGSGGVPAYGLTGLAVRALAYACLCGLGIGGLVGGVWYFLRRRKKRAIPHNVF